MSEKKKVKINGFVFTDEAEAEQAKKEMCIRDRSGGERQGPRQNVSTRSCQYLYV